MVCDYSKMADLSSWIDCNIVLDIWETPENRQNAPIISKILHGLNDWLTNGGSIKEAEAKAITQLNEMPDFRPEYLEIVDGYTLQPIEQMEDSDYVVVCTAVWAGGVRLIDNVILKGGQQK